MIFICGVGIILDNWEFQFPQVLHLCILSNKNNKCIYILLLFKLLCLIFLSCYNVKILFKLFLQLKQHFNLYVKANFRKKCLYH